MTDEKHQSANISADINDDDASGAPASSQANKTGARLQRDGAPVVGIGASAGGIGAVSAFLETLPAEPGMAFVVVQHLDPSHASQLTEVLATRSRMPVEPITSAKPIEANRVYVLPPNHRVTIKRRTLYLEDLDELHGQRTTIDHFLISLAVDCDVLSVGILFSGAGSDGAAGIRAIKDRGGLTMVQDPAEAEYASMPASAIDTGAVDAILPAAELGERLQQVFIAEDRVDREEAANRTDANAVRGIISCLQTVTGHDFSDYKRASLLRRVSRRMAVRKCSTLVEYHRYLRRHPAEASELLRDLLITVTDFFRDPEAFETLRSEVVPALFRHKKADDVVRVWVPACATGEEAYTLAMILSEHAACLAHPVRIKIFATDIQEESITTARNGIYPAAAIQNVPPEYRQRYLHRENGDYKISKEIRDLVLFARHNMLQDPPFAGLDLVSCRNLLIYLTNTAQKTVFEVVHYALGDDGYLFLGASESADAADGLFAVVDRSARIYKTNPSKPKHLPVSELSIHSLRGMPERIRREIPASPEFSYAKLHQQLLVSGYAPPSILVDEAYDIQHVSGRAREFLQIPEGAPTHNLLELVDPQIRPALRAALFQALKKGEATGTQRIRLSDDGDNRQVELRVRPVSAGGGDHALAQVIFDLSDKVQESTETKPGKDTALEPIVEQLEEELEHARAQLKATVEEYETSTEELRASNEELLSMNEELQSTAEELETSKEELQSMNEELTTVNQELNSKVGELDDVNSDLKNLLSSTNIGTLFLNRELRLKRYTEPVVHLFNLIPSDVGRPIAHVTHELDYDLLKQDATDVLESLRPIEREARATSGSWYLVRLAPYRTVDNRIDGVVVTFIDITERRAYEQALIEARDESEKLANLRAAFLANTSHEIRTPLTSIIGLSQLLGEKLQERESEMARLIHRSGLRLLETLDSVLDLSQIEAGELRPNFEEVDVAAYAADSVDMMRPIAEEKGITLEVQTSGPHSMLVTDPGFFSRIVDNLVSNAIKFTESGGVELTIRCDSERCVLDVSDTGIGIAEKFIPQLFEKFKQAEVKTGQFYRGSGLGLSLVKELVELLGGTISVDSKLGEGTQFVVELPNHPDVLAGKD